MIDVLKKQIHSSKSGTISYSEYMETVLYHPTKGYYMNNKQKVGKDGDFYTSSLVHDVYGKLFAKFFMKLIEKSNIPPIICEVGAGNGRFAAAFLEEFEKVNPPLFNDLTYHIVESSPYHRELQKEVLPSGQQIKQWSTLGKLKEAVPSFNGILYSNELFDAFPVDVVEMQNGMLMEVKVSLDKDENLIEVFDTCQRADILDWIKRYGNELIEGQRFEIPLAMTKWMEQIGPWFEKAYMLTVDYGYTREEWSDPLHVKGSLRGYYRHQMVENPLEHPGEMDLTTHIHLDVLKEVGEDNHIRYIDRVRQHEFLIRAGILEYLEEHFDPNPFSEVSKQNRAIRTLITQGGISSAFEVILQQKGMGKLRLEDLLPYPSFL